MNTLFKVLWFDLTWEMKPWSTDCEADAQTTTPLRRFHFTMQCIVAVLFLISGLFLVKLRTGSHENVLTATKEREFQPRTQISKES